MAAGVEQDSLNLGISNCFSQMSVGTESVQEGSISVYFQIGLFKERVKVPKGRLSFKSVKQVAAEIIEKKAPDWSVIGLGEKLLLFRHDPTSEQILHRLSEQHYLHDGDLVEVVLAASATLTEVKFRPHSLAVQSYRTPTFCHHCGEMLWGLVRQGLKCEGCGLDFHKRCALRLPSDCSRVYRPCGQSLSLFPPSRPRATSLSSHTGGSLEEISLTKPSRSRPPSWADRPVWLGVCDGARGGRPRVPHTFHIHTYKKPTMCQHCHRLLKGLFRQGLQCSDCRFNCHRQCESQVPADCRGERANGEESNSNREQESEEDISVVTVNAIYEEYHSKARPRVEEEPAEQPPISPCFSSNIPLMRVVQSIKHSKRRSNGILKRGWLVHHTNVDTLRKRHYWVLDRKSITLYQNENSSKFYKELPLSEVLQVRGSSQLTVPAQPDDTCHTFELLTSSVVYCVFSNTEGEAWESAIRLALMPLQSVGLNTTGHADAQATSEQIEDISLLYQIFSDEVLGSGQFGVVYGGTHRKTGRPVAIKVIDKSRFPAKQERQSKNEVAILQSLSHPGVIVLDAMFETPDCTFVIMEKLHSDMLEMILSNENGRLPERITRFIVMQILEALRYLHLRHIAHCDLKPENVLLSSPDPFPQVKLCDFGFARIIGERSFRRTVVGTPAYLAPEVISSHGYNRSLDMWAVGVILYVSLSGTFPFNEDEDIHQQITNAAFMYPRHLWALISLEAVNLINNLLQVVVRRRFSVGKAMGHPWLQNFQLWCDLRQFEQRLGHRYLTHESDDERWRQHAQEKGLSLPSHQQTEQGL
ncbi:serine/threonine-protein kinase D3-like [Tachysurus fulvidraco]|uniref:serine/threonine-protein kinase D3-like n=1 Tax=Tachysurus fulvidraco TaxID=1234273 RepID=UPI000F4E418A|nr:serine/threonine-protein kinase D3-like [Tachysurus fulvidraco]